MNIFFFEYIISTFLKTLNLSTFQRDGGILNIFICYKKNLSERWLCIQKEFHKLPGAISFIENVIIRSISTLHMMSSHRRVKI